MEVLLYLAVGLVVFVAVIYGIAKMGAPRRQPFSESLESWDDPIEGEMNAKRDEARFYLRNPELFGSQKGETTNPNLQTSRQHGALKRIEEQLSNLETLELQSIEARQDQDLDRAAGIYDELMNIMLPDAKAVAGLYPKLSKAHQLHGRALRVLELYEAALNPLKRSIQLDPDDAMACRELTICLGRLGRHGDARPYAEMAVALEPGSGGALSNLAATVFCLGEVQEARKLIEKAIRLDANDPAVRATYSMIIND